MGFLSLQLIAVSSAKDLPFWLNHKAIVAIPEVVGLDADKVSLGKRLFTDTNLSADGTVSCASCHALNLWGVDRAPVSIGVKGQVGTRNAPTVFNSSLLFRQFWDGRATTLEEQVTGPINNIKEMASDWKTVLAYLNSNDFYAMAFKKHYGGKATEVTVSHAIAEFERSLLTPNGAFDRYLKGDESAIDAGAKRGYQLFSALGCVSCHQGVAVGGNLYQKLGIIIPYYDENTLKNEASLDLGRYDLTGVEEHKFEFKVPSLRNVARTAPYFHDGSIKTLETAVQLMGKHQLGRHLSTSDVTDIVLFLESLNGEFHE